MLNLILKDYRIGKFYLLGILIIIPLVTFILVGAMIEEFKGYVVGMFTMMSLGLSLAYSFVFIGIDSSSNTDCLFASLPVKRSTIVYARYFTSMLQATMNFGLVILSCIFVRYFFNSSAPGFDLLLSVRGLVSLNILLLLILSIVLPSVFKYGAGSGFTATMIILTCFVLLGPVFKFVFQAINGIWEFDFTFFFKMLEEVLKWIISLTALQAYFLIFSSVSIIITASLWLSVISYSKRDL